MEHVKTFFKSLFIFVVLLWGFWAYMKWFNKDLWQTVASYIYKSEVQECPICELKDCPEQEPCKCDSLASGSVVSKVSLEDISDKIDFVIQKLDSNSISASVGPDSNTVSKIETGSELSQEEIIKNLEDRIAELEKTE